MTKVGVVGFGGGSALIPVMEKELVRDGLLTPDEFVQDTVIANITPGALPVKLAALSGARMGGAARAAGAAFAVAVPGTLGTVALLALFAQLGPGAIRTIEFASLGITAFIIYLLGHYVVKVLVKDGRPRVVPIVIAVLAFLATGAGKTVVLAQDILGRRAPQGGLPELSALGLVLLALLGISALSLWQYLRRSAAAPQHTGEARSGQTRRAISTAAVFVTLTLMGGAVAVVTIGGQNVLPFLGLILTSTVTSFGGGEAYVGVADGFFVASGIVESEVFYGQVVPIANALPGPILVKVAAGVAFLSGGWILAASAFVVAVASCSAVAGGVLAGYDRARNSLIIRNISTYILPVICGLLASTAVSMLHSNARIGGEAAVAPVLIILASIAAAVSVPFIHRLVHVPDILIILLFGSLSWLILSSIA